MRLFNGTIEKEILGDVLSFIGSYVSEVRVKISDEGTTFCFVNPENTVASYITIPWNCWDYFIVEEELEIGIDVRRILDILPILGDLIEVIVEKDYKLDGRTFELAFLLKSENITYIVAAIDPEWMRKCMPKEAFENIKDAAEDGTKIVLEHKLFGELVKTAKQDYLYLESHDEEIIVYNGYRELEPLEFVGIIYNPGKALYKIEYLKPLAKLKTPVELEIYFATEKPCYITTELKCAALEMVIAPYVPTEDWEAYAPKRIKYDHVITIDIPKDLMKAIKHIKPNAVYINRDNNEIYFINYVPQVRWNSYVVLKNVSGLWGMQGFYNCVSNLAEFVSEEITIGISGDKLYINDTEVGSKVAEDFKLYKPTPSYNEISIPLKDFKNLIRACGGETGRFAIVGDGECLRLVAVTPKEEIVFSHCLFSPYEEKKVIRVPYIGTLPSGIGDIVNIYYQEGLGSPIIFEYMRRKRKAEIPLFYYNATPHPEAEKEHIEELEEIIFGVEVKEEKPPEKSPEEKRELPHDIQNKLSETNGFVRQTRSYLQNLSQIYEKGLVKAFNRLYDTFREVETLVGTAPSKEALKMLDELQNEFLELGKRISLIRTKIADYDEGRLGLEIRLKPFEWHDEVKEVLTELSDIAHELRKWDSRLEDLAERIKGYVKKIQELRKKTEKAIVTPPKRTPTLEDILAELEPLGYRERWRVVESLKAKGFEDVEETIDKFIKEGKLRKVGKYIEATKGAWEEHEKKVAEEKEKPKEEEKIYVLILRPTATIETSPEEYRKVWELTKDYMFKLYEIDKLPKGFKLKPSAFGDPFLVYEYDGKEIAFGRCYFTKKGNRWFNLTHNSFENPEDIIAEYQGGLGKEYEDVEKAWNSTTTEKRKEWLEKTGETREWVIDFSSQLDWEMLDDWERKKLIPIIREELKKKLPAEEKPKEEKPPAKPPAEPYDFILEKLKSTFLAELELAGHSSEDLDLANVMEQITELAKEVYEGRKEQIEAVKEIILKARELIRKIENIRARFSDLVKEGDEIVKTYDRIRVEVIRAEELTEGEAKKKKSELDAIVKKLKAIVKELRGLYETAPLKDIEDKIEEYEDIIEEVKELKKEIDEKIVRLPEHVREILDRLKTTFVAQLELAGFSKEDVEKEWETIQPEIEKLANKVAKGETSIAEAVKEIMKMTRIIATPEVPPEEVKIVKEEKPRRIRRAEEIWKERRVELPVVGVPTVKPEGLIKKFNPILGLSSFESELEQDQAMMVLPPYIAKKGEEIQKREGDLLIPLSASFVMINYPKTLVEHGVEKATYIAFPTLWRKIGEVPFIELIPPEVELEYRDVLGRTKKGKFTRRDLLENAINYYLCKVFGLSDSEIPDKWRVSYEYLKSLNELIR